MFTVLAAVAVIAGCGGDSTSDESTETSAVESGTFPVTIAHAFGETEIPDEPERVVVVGFNEADFLYALDVAPVGVHEWWGGYPYATGPWAEPDPSGARCGA